MKFQYSADNIFLNEKHYLKIRYCTDRQLKLQIKMCSIEPQSMVDTTGNTLYVIVLQNITEF